MASLVHSARRAAIWFAPADSMAPAVRRFGERPTVARMVRRRLTPEWWLDSHQPLWRLKALGRAR